MSVVLPSLTPKMLASGTVMPRLPRVTLLQRTMTSSTINANESVAIARYTPLTRRAGKPIRMPTIPAIAPAAKNAAKKGTPRTSSTDET